MPVNSAPGKYTFVVPTLVMVTVVETCVPFVTEPKFTEVGENLIPVAEPDTATLCGLVTSLSFTLIVPVAYPTEVGLNCALMMHVPRFGMTKPFVHVVLPALVKGPVMVTAGVFKVTDTPVLFVSVIFVAALVRPTAVVAKAIVVGLRETLLVPVPLRPISCGVDGSVSLMTTEARFKPVDWGLKVTLMVQLAPPPRVVPEAGQVLVVIV